MFADSEPLGLGKNVKRAARRPLAKLNDSQLNQSSQRNFAEPADPRKARGYNQLFQSLPARTSAHPLDQFPGRSPAQTLQIGTPRPPQSPLNVPMAALASPLGTPTRETTSTVQKAIQGLQSTRSSGRARPTTPLYFKELGPVSQRRVSSLNDDPCGKALCFDDIRDPSA